MGKITACPMETPTSMMVGHHDGLGRAEADGERGADERRRSSAMRTRLVRSASTAIGSVQASAAAPAMATISRMPALVRWNASRMFGVRTLKALWVAWSSSSIPKSTPSGNRDTPPPSLREAAHGASAGSIGAGQARGGGRVAPGQARRRAQSRRS